jgi:hypothetical protein
MPKTFSVGAPSRFVTVTAWVAIVLAAAVALLAGWQQAELASLLPQWQQRPLPVVSGWLLRGMPWVLATAAGLALVLVASAIGLLLRLDWARRVFIGLVALAIAANLFGLWLQHEAVQLWVERTLGAVVLPGPAAGVFGGLLTLAQVMAGMVTVAAALVLVWVIGQLNSERVRQEFA